jgi:hypothetical protein
MACRNPPHSLVTIVVGKAEGIGELCVRQCDGLDLVRGVAGLLEAAGIGVVMQVDATAQPFISRADLSRPVVAAPRRQVLVRARCQRGCRRHAGGKATVLIVAQLAGAHRRMARDQHELVLVAELHDLAGRQQCAGGLLAADHTAIRSPFQLFGRRETQRGLAAILDFDRNATLTAKVCERFALANSGGNTCLRLL